MCYEELRVAAKRSNLLVERLEQFVCLARLFETLRSYCLGDSRTRSLLFGDLKTQILQAHTLKKLGLRLALSADRSSVHPALSLKMSFLIYLHKGEFQPEDPQILDGHLKPDTQLTFVDFIPSITKRSATSIISGTEIEYHPFK